jgi:hypothetical protein
MSAKVKAIWNLYKHGRITKAQLKAKVPVVLAEDEYEQITGISIHAPARGATANMHKKSRAFLR